MQAPSNPTSEYAYQLKWPNWLRWALLLPTVVVGRYLLGVVAFYMLAMNPSCNPEPGAYEEEHLYDLLKGVIGTFAGSYASLLVAAKLAPRHHIKSVLVLASASATVDAAAMAYKYPEIPWVNWVGFASMALGFGAAYIQVGGDVRKYTPDGSL